MALALTLSGDNSVTRGTAKAERSVGGGETMSTTKNIHRVIKQIQVTRDVEENFTPQMYQLLMEIAVQPGITMQNLMERTGLALSSVSRNLMALGEWHRFGKPGLNFVETVEDPQERRRKIAFLTPQGRKFVESSLDALYPGQDNCLDVPTAREFLTGQFRQKRERN